MHSLVPLRVAANLYRSWELNGSNRPWVNSTGLREGRIVTFTVKRTGTGSSVVTKKKNNSSSKFSSLAKKPVKNSLALFDNVSIATPVHGGHKKNSLDTGPA